MIGKGRTKFEESDFYECGEQSLPPMFIEDLVGHLNDEDDIDVETR
jgi:uncharacterized ferredoxin-like protein